MSNITTNPAITYRGFVKTDIVEGFTFTFASPTYKENVGKQTPELSLVCLTTAYIQIKLTTIIVILRM